MLAPAAQGSGGHVVAQDDAAGSVPIGRSDPEVALEHRLERSAAAARDGELDAALEHARAARAIALRLDDADGVARADYHVALAHMYGARHDAALEHANRALVAQREQGDRKAQAKTLTLVGAIHRSRSDYDEALAAHFAALDLATLDGDRAAVARSRNNIALIYWEIGDLPTAQVALDEAIATYRSLDDVDALRSALSNLGLILCEAGQPEDALVVLNEALAYPAETQSDRGLGRLLSNVAFAHELLEDYERAREYYQRSLELRERVGDAWGASRVLASIANLLQMDERYDEALQYYDRAEEQARSASALRELAIILRQKAAALRALGDDDAAWSEVERARELTAKLDLGETNRRIASIEAQVALDAQQARLRQARLVRNVVLFGSLVVVALGLSGWWLFVQKRRAHGALETVHARLTAYAHDLEAARGKILELEQLLPICSYCKSVRDDTGDWQTFESFLRDHGAVDMTHGICPTCLERELEGFPN